MSGLDDDLKLVDGMVWNYEDEYGGREGGEAMERIKADIARLRELARDAFDHPNFTPEPGDERLRLS